MKKILLLTALFVVISCEKEDDKKVELSKSDIVGIWDITKASESGESIEISSGAIVIRLNEDNTYRVNFFTNIYTGNYTVQGSTIVGVTEDPITEYFEFASLVAGKAKINYRNSEGDKYIFEATKR